MSYMSKKGAKQIGVLETAATAEDLLYGPRIDDSV